MEDEFKMGQYIIRRSSSREMYHHGIRGQKWGNQRYQSKNGDWTDAGYRRRAEREGWNYGSYNKSTNPVKSDYKRDLKQVLTHPFSSAKDYVSKNIDAIKRIDKYLDANTEFARIQVSKDVQPYAFYATYKKNDIDKYSGLFGANLQRRANAAARSAEKKAAENVDDEELQTDAKVKREYADNLNVYQVRFSANSKLKVPSDRNAEDVVAELYKDESFRSDLRSAIKDSRTQMRRPKQQALFAEAEKIMRKPTSELTRKERATLYKALNLSLTFHDKEYFNNTSDKFYGALKKKGYSAIVDINDQKYSSYHAKKPMIVFDTDSVSVKSIKELDQHYMDKMSAKYNRERAIKEIPTQIFSALPSYGKTIMSDAYQYRHAKTQEYLDSGDY